MWIIWLCSIAAVIAVLTALSFIRLPIEFEYAASATHKKQMFQVRVCHIRLIRDRKNKKKEDADTELVQDSSDSEDIGKKQDTEDEKDEKFGFSQFMKQIDWVKNIYELTKKDLEDIFSYLRSRARCRNLTVHLDFGFEDAAQTGIAGGVAYGVVYGFASLVYNNLSLRKDDMDLEVNPRFDKQCTDLYIKSIFCLAPAHIIKVLAMLLAVHKKIRKTNRKEKAVYGNEQPSN